MANDELEEINGLKPKILLQDGEEREVSSQSRYYMTVGLTRRALCDSFFFLSFFLTTAIPFIRSKGLLTITIGELLSKNMVHYVYLNWNNTGIVHVL
jgi:hypothetical protein